VYQAEQRAEKKAATFEPIKKMVFEERRHLPRLGTRKVYLRLKDKLIARGIKLGRDGLFDFLREHQMLIRPKKNYTKTTFSKHWMRKHPNLFSSLELTRSEQAFVSDITYVESKEGTHYLSLVTDAYSRKIMGYELSNQMTAFDVVKGLDMAISNRQGDKSLIHHSDRGLQYCSACYQDKLQKNDILPSMTDGYDCYQNALAERVNGILKQEFLIYECQSFKDLESLVDDSIWAYNELRPHLSLGMRTPNEVHNATI